MTANLDLIRGRQVVVYATNKSGGALVAGDVCIVDTANNEAFTTTTTSGYTGGIGVAQESIANNATGRFAIEGYVSLVNVNASVTRGNYGKTHTVAKQATDAGSSRAAGTFCQFLTGGTTPTARLYPPDLQGSVLTNPMTTTGDMIYSSDGSGTPARLAAVAIGKVLASKGTGTAPAWDYPPFHGTKCTNSAAQSISNNTATALTFDTETYDTDAFHSTASNTSRFTVPTGMGGYYFMSCTVELDDNSVTGTRYIEIRKNAGATALPTRVRQPGIATAAKTLQVTTIEALVATDYIEFFVFQDSGAAMNFGSASGAQLTSAVFELRGI